MTRFTLPALVLTVLAGTAQAHVTLEQSEATVGATTKITLRIPHGCGAEATQAVTVDLPEGVYAAKPMPKPGWTLTTQTGAYAVPYDNHGTQMTEGVRQIAWSEGDLPGEWYDEFTFRAAVQGDVGETLYFPVTQTCATGVADWTDTSGGADVPNPAPHLVLVAGTGAHMAHGHGAAADVVTVGDLSLSGGFTRATLPNAPVAGGFLTVTNAGATDDLLLSASADFAGMTQLHEMAMEGDVMKMRELPEGLPIPAGQTVALAPGGFHIMFMDLKRPLAEGEAVTVTLTFRDAGTVEMTLPVGAPNAKAGHAMHDMPAVSQ